MTIDKTPPEKKNFWQKITSPHPSIKASSERRFAFVLTILLLALIPLYFLPEGIRALVEKHDLADVLYFGSGVVILSVAYFFARSPKPRWGARLTMFYFTLIPFASLFTQSEHYAGENAENALIWSVPIMLLALILLRPDQIKFVVAVTVGIYLLIPALWSGLTYEQVFSTLGVVIAVGGLMIVSAYVQNRYLKSLAREMEQSKINERRFREIFLGSPVALWVADFSEIKKKLDSLTLKDDTDLSTYILENPEAMRGAASSVLLLDANQAAIELYVASSAAVLQENLHEIINEEAMLSLRDGVINLWQGIRNRPIETVHQTLDGVEKNVVVRFSIRSGYEDTWARINISISDVTERKAAEASMRQLASAVDASASSIVITDIDGNIEYVNPAFSRVTGYTKEEAMGENPRVLKSGQHPAEFYQEMWEVLSMGKTWQGEIINKKKNGDLYWEHASISPVRNDDGEVVSYVAVKDDITKTKESEENLRNLSSATEQSASAVVIADTKGNVEYVNPAFSEITGYTKEEIIGQKLRVLRSGKHEQKFYDHHDRIISNGEVWRGEVINKRKDGTFYWESQIISPVKNEIGEIAHYVSVRDDITEAKESRAEIRRQSKFLQTIIDGIDSPFYVLNVDDYSIALANKKAHDLGLTEKSTCYALTHQRELPCAGLEHPCPLKHVVANKEPYIVEHLHYHADGSPHHVEVYGYPIYDDEGEVVQMIEYSIDITARKKAEHQAAQLLQEQIAVRKAMEAITSTLDFDTVLNRIATEIGRAVDATSSHIWLWDAEINSGTSFAEYFSADATEVECVSSFGEKYEGNDPEFVRSLEENRYSIAHVGDTYITETYKKHMQEHDVKSALYVPIHVRGKAVAFAEIWESRKRREFSPEEIVLCQHIAQNAAVAIDNARNYQQAEAEIQQRKEAETELRKLSNAADQAASAIVITDTHGVIEYVNPAFTSITGYPVEEAIGKDPSLLKSGEHSPEFYTELWQTIARGEIWRGELINLRKDGSRYWESQVIAPVRDATDNITHYVAVKDDITKEKQAEAELRNLSNATEQTVNGIVITDMKGYIEYTNPAFTIISGYSQEELVGKRLEDIQKSGEHSQEFYKELNATIARGQIWKGEIINRRKDGTFYWESLVISPVKNDQGEVTHRVEIKEDVTRRKELEQSLSLAHEEALVASDMKTQLLANVSHDMRPPLGAILG